MSINDCRRLTTGLILLATLLSASKLPAAPNTNGGQWPSIKYEKYKLKNGLEVILSEDHRLPLVAVF